ncbi:MAG: PCMD domain-containing protein, partial [Phocaeicola sp.]|nr:PCMD domain-containing protein [Phocaeicola sp.]
MKIKNLLTCTATTLLLCTSCIKDEAPNAEADILSCILPAEILTGTSIDYNRPYDKSINAYPIHIEVNNGTDLSQLAPIFELTKGATIDPPSGSVQNFISPVRYTVTSEDKQWHRTYAIQIHYPSTQSIPTVYNFENVQTVPYNKNEYYVLYEAASGYSTLTWSSGNQGFALTGQGFTPNDFPTGISKEGRTGNCVQLITRKTGSLGAMVGMPIAAGNLFIGSFDIGSAMSDALSATRFGTTFYREPLKLVGYYK